MSGEGSPILELQVPDVHVTIVASMWHTEVMDGLIAGAQKALAEAGVARVELVRVAGSFELPLAAQLAAASADAVVALGVVIRGGTPHFEYVSSAVTQGLMQATLLTETPIGFGVLTTDNDEQALARAGLPGSQEDKGYEAAQAALSMVLTARDL